MRADSSQQEHKAACSCRTIDAGPIDAGINATSMQHQCKPIDAGPIDVAPIEAKPN
jgi:hypothetical protein